MPLAGALRGPVTEVDVRAALALIEERRPAMLAALAVAREEELETLAAREEVVTRILALRSPRGAS